MVKVVLTKVCKVYYNLHITVLQYEYILYIAVI
jgi:hypothetical protein